MRNKKGSASVFLVFILTAMVALTAVFIYAAKRAAVISYGDGILNLACRSALSEFNLELKDRYGLFAFEKTGEEVEAQIKEDSGLRAARSSRGARQQNQCQFWSIFIGRSGKYETTNFGLYEIRHC